MNQTEFHSNKPTSTEQNTFEKVKRLINFKASQLAILDVGCGMGSLPNELASMGHNVTGLDIGNITASNWKFIQTDINSHWPVEAQSFDVVICTDVPEHMYDPEHILNESKKVLNETGKLIFGVPNHFDLRQRLRTLFGKGIVHWDAIKHNETAWNFAHIRFFTHKELIKKFTELDWQIEKAQFNFMGAGILPSRLLPGFIKKLLLKISPGLFSGKFIYLLNKGFGNENTENIYISTTPQGY